MFIGATTSENIKDDIINRHYNEYYIAHKDIQIKDITLQEEEVQNIKWFDVEEIVKRVNEGYRDLTEKIGVWNYLIKYLEIAC